MDVEELNYCDNAKKSFGKAGGGWHENPVTKYE